MVDKRKLENELGEVIELVLDSIVGKSVNREEAVTVRGVLSGEWPCRSDEAMFNVISAVVNTYFFEVALRPELANFLRDETQGVLREQGLIGADGRYKGP